MGLKSDTAFDLRSQMTKQGNQFNFDGPTIIYCPTKKATNEVAAIVKGMIMVNGVHSVLKVGVSTVNKEIQNAVGLDVLCIFVCDQFWFVHDNFTQTYISSTSIDNLSLIAIYWYFHCKYS